MQRILVTGGSRGIGTGIVQRFLDRGCHVVVVSRNEHSLPEAIRNRVEFVEFDLGQVDAIGDLVAKVGQVDVLVNNAALLNSLPYDQYTPAKRDELIRVNMIAPVELATRYSQLMVDGNGGRIVNMASIAGIIGQSDIWYAMSKAAIINLTKSFAKLVGPQGVMINAVAPGPVATEMFSLIPRDRQEKVLSRTISGHPASIDDIARVVEWLSLDAPEHLNGVCIDMTNGATLR